jgi:alpha-glucosidase
MEKTVDQEPWRFGPEVEAICRKYLGLRYQLLPYLYNLFYQAGRTGAPVMRPLVWHYPQDSNTFNLNDQFMLGPDLLAAPILAPGQTARSVYLPKGTWYRWRPGTNSSEVESFEGPAHVTADAPLDELPLFVRGGAILPMWPVAQHTGAIDRANLRLHIWPGKGQLDYYEDDGKTRACERGPEGSRLTLFQLQQQAGKLALKWGPARGQYADARQTWTIVIHNLPARAATLDGNPITPRQERGSFLIRLPDDLQKHTLVM